MTQPRPDLATLAAQLRLMACALVVELMEWLGAGRLAAGLRRRMARDLAQLERFAAGLLVLMTLKTLPAPLPEHPGGERPFQPPRGFACVPTNANAMRAMQRKLFPTVRDLRARLARFERTLDDLAASAARLARHIARIPPGSRLVAIAPPATGVACLSAPACCADDTS